MNCETPAPSINFDGLMVSLIAQPGFGKSHVDFYQTCMLIIRDEGLRLERSCSKTSPGQQHQQGHKPTPPVKLSFMRDLAPVSINTRH